MLVRAVASLCVLWLLGCTAKDKPDPTDEGAASAKTAEPASRNTDRDPGPDREPGPEPDPEPDPDPSDTASDPIEARAPVEGFFMAEGAPPPRTCKVAADCINDTIAELDQPCCQNPYSMRPHARAYRTWLVSWRTGRCGDITCPPPPTPPMPRDCAYELSCVEGVCQDACPRN